MFADSLLETSWSQRSRRSWTTLTSFGLEAMAIGLLLLLPLWRTVGLPTARVVSTPVSAFRSVSEQPFQQRAGSASNTHASILVGRIMQPSPVPTTFKNGGDETTSLGPVSPIGIGTDGVNLPVGHGADMPFNLGGTRTILPVHPVATAPAFRKSSLLEGNLIRKVPPVYPSLARNARIQGSVVVYALISKAGTIENLQVLSGHPMLAGAAIEAIRQWRYRPYILNSEPIEVETQITVTFSLAN